MGSRQLPGGEGGTQEGVLMRRFMILLTLLLVVGCSSGSDSGDIAFEHVFDFPTGTSVWSATGQAIDDGLFCSSATGVMEGIEDEDGNPRTFQEADALHDGTEPYVSVSVESMTCDDGSGDFTLRLTSELDPTLSSDPMEQQVSTTWTITGGTGFDGTTGGGDSERPEPQADSVVVNATGTITN